MPSKPYNHVWYELTTSDPASAVTFYKDVVGWTADPMNMDDYIYTVMKAGEARICGICAPMPGGEGVPPAWLGYVGVPNVDEAAKAARDAGASEIVPPMDIPNIGRFSVLIDPQGGRFALFSSESGEPPAYDPMAPGHIAWNELMSKDPKAAFEFYSSQFGWTADQGLDMGEMGTYQLFNGPKGNIGGMMKLPPGMPNSVWTYYFVVPALDAAAERVKKGGGKVTLEATEVPGGAWIINATDPGGAMFGLVSMQR